MEELEDHLICSPHHRVHLLSKSAPSAHQTTPAPGLHTHYTVTATPRSRSPLTEVRPATTLKDSAPCLSLPLSSAIYQTPLHRVTPASGSTRSPTACTVTHSPRHHASLPALIKCPLLPVPVIRALSWVLLPVGLLQTVLVCWAPDSRASCLTLGP